MAIWKEVRCDAVPIGPDCYSNTNRGPMGFEPTLALVAEARAEGWRGSAAELICPACLAARTQEDE